MPPFLHCETTDAANVVCQMKLLLPLLAALLASTPLFAADDERFVPLFNGKDLSGWHPVNVATDTFFVRDGMLITTGHPIGVMASERMYENFIIELDWQHMEYAGNSGLYVWGEPMPAPGVPFSKGIEVQILDLGYEKQHPDGANKWFTSQGDLFPIWGATMTPLGRIAGKRSFPTENRTKPSPEWNHYHVECNQGEIRLSINGKEVTTAKDCVPRKGFLCLESEGAECHFKNIRIKELPSSNTPPEQTARAYAGFHQLFDGKGLGGWKTPDDVKPFWTAEEAHFNTKPNPAGKGKDLWTEKEFGDFELIADWRVPGPAKKKGKDKSESPPPPKYVESAILLRGSTQLQVRIAGGGSGSITEQPPSSNADLQPGQWNRLLITVKGGRISVKRNDVLVTDQAPLPPGMAAKGPIGLQHGDGGIEFANLFIKER